MKGLGWTLLCLGVLLCGFGLVMDTSAEVPRTYDAYAGAIGGGRVNNIGLVATAIRITVAGGFLALIGAIFVAADHVRPESETAASSIARIDETPSKPRTATASTSVKAEPSAPAEQTLAENELDGTDRIFLWVGGALLLGVALVVVAGVLGSGGA